MNKRGKAIGLGMMALILLVAIMSACAPGAPPEKLKAKVKVMFETCNTGPIAIGGAPMGMGCMESTEYYTTKWDVPIDVMWEEMACDSKKGMLVYKRAVADGCALYNSVLSSNIVIFARTAKEDNIVISSGPPYPTPAYMEPEQYVFSGTVPYSSYGVELIKWFLKERWTEPTRHPKIGAMLLDSSSGWDVATGAKWACEQYGADFIGYEVLPFFGCTDSTTEWLRLAGKGADAVVCYAAGVPAIVLTRDYYILGLEEKGITMLSATPVDEVWDVVGRETLEGHIFDMFNFYKGDAEKYPLIAEISEKCGERWGEPGWIELCYAAGWQTGAIIAEGLRIAVERVGAENVDGRALRDAMVSIRNFDNGVVPPSDLTEEKPWFLDKTRICQIRGGKITIIRDWELATLMPRVYHM